MNLRNQDLQSFVFELKKHEQIFEEYDKCMKRFKLQNLMSHNKSQLILFILCKPLQVTSDLNVGKVPKRKRQHFNSIKQMNVNMQNVSGYKIFFGCN